MIIASTGPSINKPINIGNIEKLISKKAGKNGSENLGPKI